MLASCFPGHFTKRNWETRPYDSFGWIKRRVSAAGSRKDWTSTRLCTFLYIEGMILLKYCCPQRRNIMRILAIDIGTGTQDILLFDSSGAVENCVKMVMPSPTALLAERIHRATALGQPILFTGVTMGGGPSKRALSRHTGSGLAA